MADAVPAHIIEPLDAELGGETAGMRPTGGILDGRCGHRVVHHDRQLVRVVDAIGLNPHGGELQIDQHGHVDLNDHGVTDRHQVLSGLAGQYLFDDGHAHQRTSVVANVWSMANHSARPTRLKKSSGRAGRNSAALAPLSSHSPCSMATAALPSGSLG